MDPILQLAEPVVRVGVRLLQRLLHAGAQLFNVHSVVRLGASGHICNLTLLGGIANRDRILAI
ncbi:hypothetical protein D3C75_1143730 [compost metagenome]